MNQHPVVDRASVPMRGRASNARLGMILFVAAETMFFVVLLAAYIVLRYSSHNFQGMPPTEVGPINLLLPLLIVASLALRHARLAGERGSLGAYRIALWGTVVTGLGSVAAVLMQWAQWNAAGQGIGTNVKAGFAFALTGAHVVHLTGGLIPAMLAAVRSARMNEPMMPAAVLSAQELYWGFVGVVALVIVLLLHSA